MTYDDLDDLLAAEAAADVELAREGAAEAGERLVDSLIGYALVAAGRERPSIPIESERVVALLGLTKRRGRRPRSGPGSRLQAAQRLRWLVDLARAARGPEPMLDFFRRAATEIETGSEDPRRALGVRRGRGRPMDESEFLRDCFDFLTLIRFNQAVERGARRDDALVLAGDALGDEAGRGRSDETARRALRRLRRKPPNS